MTIRDRVRKDMEAFYKAEERERRAAAPLTCGCGGKISRKTRRCNRADTTPKNVEHYPARAK